MKIKKFLAMMIAAATLCGGFYSCSDDDEDAPSTSNQDQKPEKNPAANDSTSNGGQTTNSVPAELIAGKYDGIMTFVVMGSEIPNNTTFEIVKVDNNHVDVIVPSVTFGTYTIPSLTVNDIEVVASKDNGKEVVSANADKIQGSVVVDGSEKNYTLSNISVSSSDNELKMECAMQYGMMPSAQIKFEGKK